MPPTPEAEQSPHRAASERAAPNMGGVSIRVFFWGNLLAVGLIVTGMFMLLRVMDMLDRPTDLESIIDTCFSALLFSPELRQEAYPSYAVLMAGVGLGLMSNLIALLLGFAGLFAPQRRYGFAILGILLAGGVLLLVGGGGSWFLGLHSSIDTSISAS